MLACRPRPLPFASPAAHRPSRRMQPIRSHTEIAESLHLLKFPEAATEEEVDQVVDGIWSLQYMAAGPICGSAGPLSQFRCRLPSGGAAPGTQPLPCQPFTHAVLFRYANATARERFEAQPRVQLMLGGTGAPTGTAISTINFQGRVPNELEAIFRRGGEWEAGVELVVALALQGGSSVADGDEFLSLTQQLALSSAFGAVQCSFGPCASVQHTGGGDDSAGAAAAGGNRLPPEQQQRPDLMMLVRFQEVEQLQAFLDCPPVAALLQGDDRIPLLALWSCVLELQPSNSSSTRGVQGGLM